jgi:signal transduction histidine kinase
MGRDSSSANVSTRWYGVLILLCFAAATAAFIGANVFADAQLEKLAQLTSHVSDNAMPSLAYVGTMRQRLAWIEGKLDDAAEGEDTDLLEVELGMKELEGAIHAYERVPMFPREPAVWARARPALAEVGRAFAQVASDLQAGMRAAAREHLTRNFDPAAERADEALLELREVDIEEGFHYAAQAHDAYARTRRALFIISAGCTVFTGALAWLAWHGARRAVATERRRAAELDAFAARVAHDLRGPLTPPIVALQRLAQGLGPDSSQRPMIERGIRSLRGATVLIDDLLLFARASAAPGSDACASLPEVVSNVAEEVGGEAAAASVHVSVDALPDRQVRCAPGVLSSILGNLVRNAIKYMPRDAAERRVSIRGADAAHGVRIEVSDSGAGVPEDLQKHIFEPYVRGASSEPGLGLGLATVRRLVQAHGGRVGIQSHAGRGSVFWFELPAKL